MDQFPKYVHPFRGPKPSERWQDPEQKNATANISIVQKDKINEFIKTMREQKKLELQHERQDINPIIFMVDPTPEFDAEKKEYLLKNVAFTPTHCVKEITFLIINTT